MAKVYEFLATGFEDIEALAPLDILRRGGVEVVTVSITDNLEVVSAHNVTIKADKLFDEIDSFDDADMIFLPGGMPGAENLRQHKGLAKVIEQFHKEKKKIAAICAAPMVLGKLGILKGKKATCYPGFDKFLDEATYTNELVTNDEHITTAKGPAAAMMFGFNLLSQLSTKDLVEQIKSGMLINEIIALHK